MDTTPGAGHAARAVKGVGAERIVLAEGLGDLHKLHASAPNGSPAATSRVVTTTLRAPFVAWSTAARDAPACHNPYPTATTATATAAAVTADICLKRAAAESIERTASSIGRCSPSSCCPAVLPYAAPERPPERNRPDNVCRETRPVFLPTDMVIPLSLST